MVNRHAAGALDELVTEAALPRARRSRDQDDGRSAGPRVVQDAVEQGDLTLAADEAGEATGSRAVQAAPDLAPAPQLEHAHGSARALEALLAAVVEVEEARRQPRGLLGHRDAARGGQLLDPGGQPDDVALGGVVHAKVVADPPHHDLAGVQAHPHRELEPALAAHVLGERAELVRQVQGGRTGPLGMVLVRDRGAEQRHDAVAGVLVDGALVAVNAVRQDPEEAIEEAVPFLGIDALGELHRAGHVGEEHGDQLALSPERAPGREDLLDEMSRRVGARLRGDRGCDEGRPTAVAESRAGGIIVSARSALHRR